MKKVNENKGFSLAELLIVVAIIAVLVAIAIPTFSDQLERSREAVDISNLRNAYSQALTKILTIPTKNYPVVVEFKQQTAGWTSSTSDLPFTLPSAVNFTASDGAKTLFFTKTSPNDDEITVSTDKPDEAKEYTLASSDTTFKLENLEVDTEMTTTGTFANFSNANGDVGTPISVAAIDFNGIKGLKYTSKSDGTGFEISGKPETKTAAAVTVTVYMLDKNGVLGYYEIENVAVAEKS